MNISVNKLIEALGGTQATADLANIKPPSVSAWKEVGRIPDDKLIRLAPILEQRGIATRKQLFPSDWQAIWPELALAAAPVVYRADRRSTDAKAGRRAKDNAATGQ